MAVWVFSPAAARRPPWLLPLYGQATLGWEPALAPPPSLPVRAGGHRPVHLGLWGCRGQGSAEGGGRNPGSVPTVTCMT